MVYVIDTHRDQIWTELGNEFRICLISPDLEGVEYQLESKDLIIAHTHERGHADPDFLLDKIQPKSGFELFIQKVRISVGNGISPFFVMYSGDGISDADKEFFQEIVVDEVIPGMLPEKIFCFENKVSQGGKLGLNTCREMLELFLLALDGNTSSLSIPSENHIFVVRSRDEIWGEMLDKTKVVLYPDVTSFSIGGAFHSYLYSIVNDNNCTAELSYEELQFLKTNSEDSSCLFESIEDVILLWSDEIAIQQIPELLSNVWAILSGIKFVKVLFVVPDEKYLEEVRSFVFGYLGFCPKTCRPCGYDVISPRCLDEIENVLEEIAENDSVNFENRRSSAPVFQILEILVSELEGACAHSLLKVLEELQIKALSSAQTALLVDAYAGNHVVTQVRRLVSYLLESDDIEKEKDARNKLFSLLKNANS